MRYVLALSLIGLLTGGAVAALGPAGNPGRGTSNRFEPGAKGLGDGANLPRTGGDTIEDATVIPALPFEDSGATCGFAHDYSDCVFNAGAPDVVYSYTPSADGGMNVSLCGSGYDTALWIYASTVGNTVGCNDDFCQLQSEIDGINITAGVTYYIVISGYSNACGSYALNVTPEQPCDVVCPAGSQIEGEPACYDGYMDNYNGGCNSSGWFAVAGDSSGVADICGLSDTYLYNGASWRDTDWFDCVGNGQVATMTVVAEFPVQIYFLYPDCPPNFSDYVTAPPCVEVSDQRVVPAGQHFWAWVGPSVFTGVPCTSEYWLHLSGLAAPPQPVGACCADDASCTITPEADCTGTWQGEGTGCDPNVCQPVPVRSTSWGSIKTLYKCR